jgi:hypothetical protein
VWWSVSSMAAKVASGRAASARMAMTAGTRVVSDTGCMSYDTVLLQGLG